MTVSRRTLLLGALPLLALPAACDRAQPPAPSANFQAVDITGATYALDFALPDTHGQVRRLADFRGKAVVVFFGYMHCPDVCPTTMAELAQVKQLLGPEGARLQPIFVTVDPERDSPELLEAYVRNFGPDFIALRGSVDATKALAQSFKAYFAKVPGQDAASYTMDHTAGAYVYDPQGRIRLFVRYGQPVQAWVSDLKQLLA